MLDTMIDVFFSPGEASMQRAKASTANYWQDGFIALAVTLFFSVMFSFLGFLLDAIFAPNRPPIAPNERIEVVIGLIIVFLASALILIIAIMWTLTMDLGITTVLVRYVNGHWPSVGPYVFINILCISPVLILASVVQLGITMLPTLLSPHRETISSIIFTPLGFYQLYLHYLNLKVSFSLSSTNATWIIVLPAIIFICALPCLIVTVTAYATLSLQ